MFIVRQHQEGVDIEHLKFIKEATDFPLEPYRLHVDSKVSMVIPIGSYNADTYKTTVDIGAAYGGNAPSPGRYYLIDSQGAYVDLGELTGISTVVILNGNWSGRTVFIGRSYLMSYKFSRFLIKIEDESGTQSEDTGRLQLRRAWVNYKDTGALRLIVRNGEREFVNTFNGYTIGQQTIGTTNIGDGQYRFAMNGNALTTSLTLESDYPTPVSIVGCGWEASYAKKARSV